MASYTALEKCSFVFYAFAIYLFLRLIFRTVYTYVIGPLINQVDFKSMGKWAVVTGCTDGIGKEYARQLAEKGCNIVLISRTLDKLKKTAEEIEKEFKVETKIIQADFTQGNIYEGIANELSGLEVGTLVNNVGVSYDIPHLFLEIPEWDQKFNQLLMANVTAMTRMSYIVMPEMIKRGKGVVINIASGTAIIPAPMLAIYGATKAYVRKLSDCLRIEYSDKGIIFQCINPGYVISNMSKLRRPTFSVPTPKDFVKVALGLVGTADDDTGYFAHSLLLGSICVAREHFGKVVDALTKRSMENIRSRSLKKYKKQ